MFNSYSVHKKLYIWVLFLYGLEKGKKKHEKLIQFHIFLEESLLKDLSLKMGCLE